MVDYLAPVVSAALEIGLVVDGFVLDGEWHRVPVEGKKRSNLSGAYCLRELNLRNGSSAVVGVLWNHTTGQSLPLNLSKSDGLSSEDLMEARKEQQRMRRAAREEREREYATNAERAEKIWAALPEAGRSLYLKAKKVKAWGVRFSRGSIVVPVRDVAGKLWSLQFISAGGEKKFLSGGAKRGRFHALGEWPARPAAIGVCEGYATAATVLEGLVDKVEVSMAAAFDAGNLKPVAEALKKRYPGAHIFIFADNDAHNGYPCAFIVDTHDSEALQAVMAKFRERYPAVQVELVSGDDPRLKEKDKHFNTGVAQALLAAAAVWGSVLVPEFDGLPVAGEGVRDAE